MRKFTEFNSDEESEDEIAIEKPAKNRFPQLPMKGHPDAIISLFKAQKIPSQRKFLTDLFKRSGKLDKK